MALRILYVEDNPDALPPIQRIATHKGYQLFTAETLAEGLSLLQSCLPTLVLLDMLLPDGDGTDFTQQARAQGFTDPIIIISGYAMQGEREASFASGCTDFLVKPVEVDAFIDLFQSYDGEAVQ